MVPRNFICQPLALITLKICFITNSDQIVIQKAGPLFGKLHHKERSWNIKID